MMAQAMERTTVSATVARPMAMGSRPATDVAATPDPRRMVIRFIVYEGRQYKVGSVKFTGNKLFSTEEIAAGRGPLVFWIIQMVHCQQKRHARTCFRASTHQRGALRAR